MEQPKSKFACPGCGKHFVWKPELARRKARCTGCGRVVVVPAAPQGQPAPGVPDDGPAAVASVNDVVLDHCPSCGQPLPAHAVLCVQCGFNLQTGQHLGTTVDKPAATKAAPAVLPQAPARAAKAVAKRPAAAAADTQQRRAEMKRILLPLAIALGAIVVLVGAGLAVRMLGSSKSKTPLTGDALLAQRVQEGGREVIAWLEKAERHMLMGMTRETALARMKGLYEMGATKIYAFGENFSAVVIVELPQDAAARKRIFDWHYAWHKQMFPNDQPPADTGQKMLEIKMGM